MVSARLAAVAAVCCLASAILTAQAPAGPGRGAPPAGAPAAAPNPNPPPVASDPALPMGQGRPGALFGKAHANITGANGLTGTADFYEIANGGNGHMVQVVLNIQNAPPGIHGVHIHAVGKCEGPAFTTAGGHFDPGPAGDTNADTNHPFHMGDLPNVTVGPNGIGMFNVYTTRVTMGGPTGLFDADGSAIVIHANLDPGVGGPAGSGISGGPRLACGVIER
jgi:superoxide dismutase, Cu-Zn family